MRYEMCVSLCSSFLFRPGDTLQDFFLILVQTNSKGRVSGTTDLHFVHLYLCQIQLLKRRKKTVELSEKVPVSDDKFRYAASLQ